MKSSIVKFLSAVVTSTLVVTGLTVSPATAAADPYTLTVQEAALPISSDLVAAANRVYWKSGNQLWTSDGTTDLSVHTFEAHEQFSLRIASPQYTEGGFWDNSRYINRSVTIGDTIYFWASSPGPTDPTVKTWDVWKSDGTVNGTVRVSLRNIPFAPGNSITVPSNLYLDGTNIYFWGHFSDINGTITRNLLKLDTTSNMAMPVPAAPTSNQCMDSNFGSHQQQFAKLGTKLLFDYVESNCVVKIGALDLNSNTFESVTSDLPIPMGAGEEVTVTGPQAFVVFNNRLYFDAGYTNVANTGNSYTTDNSELWSTDGTAANTSRVTSLGVAGVQGWGSPRTKDAFMRPGVFGGYLYFLGWDNNNSNYALWRTDGNTAPMLWLSGSQLPNAGKRTNVPPTFISNGATSYLVTDATHPDGGQQMYAVNLSTKAVSLLTSSWTNSDMPTFSDTVGVINNSYAATDFTTPINWNSKLWWHGRGINSASQATYGNIFYTDGTAGNTAKATNWQTGDNGLGISYVASDNSAELVDQFGGKSTHPLVATQNALWFLKGPGELGGTWTLYKLTVTPTLPPGPSLICSNQITKLKVEAESASDLQQGSTNVTGFSGTVCEYNMSVDNKTPKVDFTPTITAGSAVVKVGGVQKNAALKSGKLFTMNLGGAGTTTTIDFAFGSNTYRVNVERKAPVSPGARDPQFSAPTLNGAVITVDKDVKKEVNQNGDKKDTEVTYLGGTFDGKVAKLDERGKKDETFASKLPSIAGTVTAVKVDEQHRILVGGENVDGNKDVVRLKVDGSKDASFSGPDLGAGKKVHDIDVTEDGKVVVVGDFGDGKNVKKLKDNGSEDENFKSKLPTIPGEINTAKIQEDGKILLGGKFENVDGDDDKDKIIRLEKDGALEADFEPKNHGAHFKGDVEDIETQKDGKIIVVGQSTKTNADEADKVSRLNEDGHEDNTFEFNGNIPSDKKVEAVKVKDTGEIYIAGNFDNVGDGDGDKIVKVKKDGQVDTDWNPPQQGGDVHDIELEKHGKVFIGGEGSGDGDRCDKVHEDGDRDGDKPRYDSIDDDRASNKVDTGVKGQTKIHGDGFEDGTTVTIGGKPAKVVKIDDRDEELTIQVPTPDTNHKGGPDQERKPADIVITVPNGTSTPDVIEIKEGFGYIEKKAPQQIKPDNDTHINSDKDDEDGKGKVQDNETLSAHIPSDDPISHVSKTPAVCVVDEHSRVHYLQRGDCKIVTDAPGDMGHVDPAPVTEIIPVVGLDPALLPPIIPDFSDPTVPEVPETGYPLPAPINPNEVPVVYTPVDPQVCDVTDGVVVPIDSASNCVISVTTPGTTIYEPTDPTLPPVQVTIPSIAWVPPIAPTLPGLPLGTLQDPDVPAVAAPPAGGTVKLGNDLAIKYDKAKGTLTPTAWGIYFGPIQATINYSWNSNGQTSATYSCVVKWGVLKKWSKLSKADQKKYKKPLGAKVFTTTGNCKVNALAKAALSQPGTVFTATSDVLRTRMWPATYKPEKPIIPNVRPVPVPIEPRLRHYTLTISTQ